MRSRADMAAKAYRAALQLRTRTQRGTNVPVCPFDVADEIGVEVRFTDIASLEAVYVDDGSPKILIAADRHIFGHGTHLSCVDFSPADHRAVPGEEFLAQTFGGYLLLPKSAVAHAFAARGWDLRQGVPGQFYTVAGLLGVSFDGLITHCERSLRLLGTKNADSLRSVKLPQLRAQLAGRALPGNLTVLDSLGMRGTIDLRVGDHVIAPPGATAISCALAIDGPAPTGVLLRAIRPGLSGIRCGAKPTVGAVRIARAGYVGRAIFRHLEDPDDV
jgi:hypothetical protein